MSDLPKRKPMLSDEDAAAIGMNSNEKYGTYVTPKSIACCVRDWYEARIDDGTLKIVSNTTKRVQVPYIARDGSTVDGCEQCAQMLCLSDNFCPKCGVKIIASN